MLLTNKIKLVHRVFFPVCIAIVSVTTVISTTIFKTTWFTGMTTKDVFYSQVVVDQEARCFGICTYNEKCLSFDYNVTNSMCRFFSTQSIDRATLIEASGVVYRYRFLPRDCLDWFKHGNRENKVYTIYVAKKYEVDVFCDMKTDEGGWTVFQRRGFGDNDVSLFRDSSSYKNGFGEKNGDYWLGNRYIHHLTTYENQEIYARENHTDDGVSIECKSSFFRVSSESNSFAVNFQTFVETDAESTICPFWNVHNGTGFHVSACLYYYKERWIPTCFFNPSCPYYCSQSKSILMIRRKVY